LWTGKTARGHRFFRSAWFSSTDLITDEPQGRDLPYNSRAVKALRYQAWRRPDAKLTQLLHEWARAWVSAANRTDKGKPKGLVPASIRFADESFNGDGATWHRANMMWPYFEWEHGGGSMILDHLLFTSLLTGDERLLEPMFAALGIVQSESQGLMKRDGQAPAEGSRTWAAKILIECEPFWNVVEQWRFCSSNREWDELILRYGSDYARYRLTGNEQFARIGLQRLLDDVRFNKPLKTSEVIHTDRVSVTGVEHLKAMLTGDGTYESLSPYFAVTWERTDEEFSALVSETGEDRLRVLVYSFAPEDSEIVMRPWRLSPGNYVLRLETNGNAAVSQSIAVKQPGERVELVLPSRRLLSVRFEPTR
jgi:hypothetical protein